MFLFLLCASVQLLLYFDSLQQIEIKLFKRQSGYMLHIFHVENVGQIYRSVAKFVHSNASIHCWLVSHRGANSKREAGGLVL